MHNFLSDTLILVTTSLAKRVLFLIDLISHGNVCGVSVPTEPGITHGAKRNGSVRSVSKPASTYC